MPIDSVNVERRGAVAVITLNRPEQANSLDLPMAQEFFAAAAKCGDAAVRAVVLSEDAQVFDATLAIAERIAAGPSEAFGRTKQLVGQVLAGLESQMALESAAVATQAQSSEGREGISAFLGKRSPVFVPATLET